MSPPFRSLAPAAALSALVPFSFAGPSPAPAGQDIVCCFDEVNHVETSRPGIRMSGYVDAGYTYNFIGRGDTLTTRALADDANPRGDFNLYAAKLVLEKPLTQENKLQAGFRADLIMGEDAGNLGNNGGPNISDSVYLQQAYAQFRLPWGTGLDIIAGKWQAVIGYEAEERPTNPNITPGVVSLIDPSWYLGTLATYKVNPTVELSLGVGNGSGVDNGAGIDSPDQYAVTGYIGFKAPGNNADTYLGFHYAPGGDVGYAPENESLIILNWDGNWKPEFARDQLLLAFNTSLASFNDFSSPAPANVNDASAFFGVALYAKYQFNSLVSLAGRAEYAHTDDSQFLALPTAPPGTAASNDIWTWTATLGFDLAENLMMRAEYRIDFGDDVRTDLSGNTTNSAQMIATEIVYSF